MSNRNIVIGLIEKANNALLNAELEYHMEVEREDSYDLADALNDAHDQAIDLGDRKLTKIIRLILIDAGYYYLQPEKPQSCRDFRITVNGLKYDCISGWDTWLE
jgi:hypothetical protein